MGGDSHISKACKNNNGIKASMRINNGPSNGGSYMYSGLDNSNLQLKSTRVATPRERWWFLLAEKANKFISEEELNMSSYEIY